MPELHLPNDAAACARHGEELMRAGLLDGADQAFRHALALQPALAGAAIALVRLMLARGRAHDALHFLDAHMPSIAQPPMQLLLLRAQILLAANAHEDAIPAFRHVIALSPENGAAELGLAIALGESGQAEAAEKAARNAIEKGADHHGSRYVRGRALFETNRFDEAEMEFREVLRLRPDHASAHSGLAELLWMRTGDVRTATRELDAILRNRGGEPDLRIVKAKLLDTAGCMEDALFELERGLEHAPENLALHLATSQIAIKADSARALAHAERAVQLAPSNPFALGTHADALLAAGCAKKALGIADRLHEINPGDSRVIALQATAWRMLDDSRYGELSDYASFVRATLIDVPDGWSSLPDYLADLTNSLRDLHRLKAHPVDQSLRQGTQVDLRANRLRDPAIQAFGQAVEGPIRRYLSELGSGDDVLRRRNSGDYKLNGLWSVQLRPDGHHFNHFHGKGWLSSACYIHLPDALGAANGEGWLKFGEPGLGGRLAQAPEYFVRPEPGLLVLFPSWMWHGTVPFSGAPQDRRLTVAFDVVPA